MVEKRTLYVCNGETGAVAASRHFVRRYSEVRLLERGNPPWQHLKQTRHKECKWAQVMGSVQFVVRLAMWWQS
jgi:hypothetical protein